MVYGWGAGWKVVGSNPDVHRLHEASLSSGLTSPCQTFPVAGSESCWTRSPKCDYPPCWESRTEVIHGLPYCLTCFKLKGTGWQWLTLTLSKQPRVSRVEGEQLHGSLVCISTMETSFLIEDSQGTYYRYLYFFKLFEMFWCSPNALCVSIWHTGVAVDSTSCQVSLPEAATSVEKMTQSVQVTPKLPGESAQEALVLLCLRSSVERSSFVFCLCLSKEFYECDI